MNKKYKYKSAGFTLIELLVVIAIIGILASIVIATVSRVRASARDAKRVAALRTIDTAMGLWTSNKSYVPDAAGNKVEDPAALADTNNIKVPCNTTRSSTNLNVGECFAMKSNSTNPVPTFFGAPGSGFATENILTTQIKDPTDPTCFVLYVTDGVDYETMTVLENDPAKMQNDGGNESGAYERGSNINLGKSWTDMGVTPCAGGGGSPPPPPPSCTTLFASQTANLNDYWSLQGNNIGTPPSGLMQRIQNASGNQICEVHLCLGTYDATAFTSGLLHVEVWSEKTSGCIGNPNTWCPDTQLGGDSDNTVTAASMAIMSSASGACGTANNGAEVTFSWSANMPQPSAGSNFWIGLQWGSGGGTAAGTNLRWGARNNPGGYGSLDTNFDSWKNTVDNSVDSGGAANDYWFKIFTP